MYEPKKLYAELNNVKCLEIFGLSPYGENDLIDKLNELDMVTVYVYDKHNNEEAVKWNSLKCKHVIKDTQEIYRN